MRFSIRDLLWLTVVVALAVGWWLDRQNLVRELDAIQSGLDSQKNRAAVESLFPGSYQTPPKP